MRPLERRSHRCEISLWLEDTTYLSARFGWGWSAKIRDLTHKWVEQLKAENESEIDGTE